MVSLEKSIREVFPTKKLLVVGDLVADQFLRGDISRVSREAPVFILKHEDTETLGGGAANAATNVASLNGNARLVGVIGNDKNGSELLQALDDAGVQTGGIVADPGFSTTTKVRVLAGQHYAIRQQVIRIDYENENPLSESAADALVQNALDMIPDSDTVILADYGYGVADVCFGPVIEAAREKGIPILLDSRRRLGDFPGVTAATPNKEETERLLGREYEPGLCEELRRQLNLRALLVTLGNCGMLLVEEGQEPLSIGVVGGDEPVDVTGAGDTVIATLALGIASGLDYPLAARVANHTGGIVVMKNGTSTASTAELMDSIREHEASLFDSTLSIGQ